MRLASALFLFENTRLSTALTLFFLAGLLLVGGLFVHSASAVDGEAFPSRLAQRHFALVGIGLGLMVLFVGVRPRGLVLLAPPLYAIGIALLVYLLYDKYAHNHLVSRWIHLPGFTLQPSELMKLFTVLAVAMLLTPWHRPLQGLGHLWPWLVVGVPTLLIARQPDLGTAVVLPVTLIAMLWTAGISPRRIVAYLATAVAAIPVAWFFFLHDYQQRRVLVFLDPEYDASATGASYQIHQSLIAIGSGGPTGKGYLKGPQNTLDVLPEEHNDFIFGVIGEEWGLVGTLTVVALFGGLYLSCLAVAYGTRDPFGRLTIVGITSWLAFQTAVNLAMTIGLAPVTGLPLPFVSAGGSSLVSCLAAIGIVLAIGLRPTWQVQPDGLSAGVAATTRRSFARLSPTSGGRRLR